MDSLYPLHLSEKIRPTQRVQLRYRLDILELSHCGFLLKYYVLWNFLQLQLSKINHFRLKEVLGFFVGLNHKKCLSLFTFKHLMSQQSQEEPLLVQDSHFLQEVLRVQAYHKQSIY